MPNYVPTEGPPDELAPVLPFDDFMTYVFRWLQDQHVGIIGPTEQGKTNLAYHLLLVRSYIAYLGIKSEDGTFQSFMRHGYERVYDWPPKAGRIHKKPVPWSQMPRRLVWPDAHDRRGARAEQRRVFHHVLDDVWARGMACVVWDDFWYMVNILGLELDAKQNLLNARSATSPQLVISQRAGGNRMVELTDQPTWLFWAHEPDERNLKIVGPAGSVRRGFVERLDRYQFLAENTRTGQRYRITAPLLEAA